MATFLEWERVGKLEIFIASSNVVERASTSNDYIDHV